MFDAVSELSEIRELRQRNRKKSFRRERSRLDKFTFELLELHRAGASSNDLQLYLKNRHRVRVDRSTISRWLQKNASPGTQK